MEEKMKEKIKLGIFGLNRGASFYSIIKTHGGEVVAICDSNESRISKSIEKLGEDAKKVTSYTDFEEFFKHDMDAVFLANGFHQHAPYAVRFLEKGVHVLSECVSNGTLGEGVALVRAAEKSNAVYMLAENYPYMKFNQEMKKVYSKGSLGRAMYAEGEYNHPVGPDDAKFILKYKPYELHWRNYNPASYYITHSLAPLMYITGAFPKRVTAMPVYAPLSDDYASGSYVGDQAAIITCLNDDDSVFKVTGCAHFGAHGNSYRVCCEKGQIENIRGSGGKVMLRYNSWDIPEGMEENNYYMPEWDPEFKEEIEKSGHGGGDFFVFKNFFECIRENKKPDFDVYFATTTASVAIMAHRSVLAGGQPFDIPDFRKEEDRKRYEDDYLTPYPGLDGTPPTLECCSHPEYRPSDIQLAKYRAIIDPKKD